MPGSKRTAVPAGMSSRCPWAAVAVEPQRRVGLGEVVVRADLHGPVAGVDDGEPVRGRPSLSVMLPVGGEHLAGPDGGSPGATSTSREIGRWTVTSLVPSGKVASTWTSASSSGDARP